MSAMMRTPLCSLCWCFEGCSLMARGVSVLFVLGQDFRDAVSHASRQLGKPVIEDRILNQILYYLPQLYELNRDLLRELEERLSHWWLSIKGFHSFDVEIYLGGLLMWLHVTMVWLLCFMYLPKCQTLLCKYRRCFFHLDVLFLSLRCIPKGPEGMPIHFCGNHTFYLKFRF